MSTERRSPPATDAEARDEKSDRAMRIVVGTNEAGEPMLQVRDGSFEETYRVGDAYSTTLFLAVCRSQGLLPYRRARQHEGTVCVRASLREHDAAWSRFLELSRQLEAKLMTYTLSFVRSAGLRDDG
jgi:hypothetical protein